MRDEVERTDEPCRYKPGRPIAVTVASIIWIAYGCFWLLNATLMMVGTAVSSARLIPTLRVVLIPSALAAVIVFVGVQTLRSKMHDTIWSGMVSIALGLLYFTLIFPLMPIKWSDSDPGLHVVLGFVFLAILLVAAGILALVGRHGYRVWREMQKLERM